MHKPADAAIRDHCASCEMWAPDAALSSQRTPARPAGADDAGGCEWSIVWRWAHHFTECGDGRYSPAAQAPFPAWLSWSVSLFAPRSSR